MIKIKTKPLLLLLILLITLITGVLYLEYSYQNCKKQIASTFLKSNSGVSCYELSKLVEKEKFAVSDSYPNIYEVERRLIGLNNGITCSRVGYVASDLPKYAKEYVILHEYLHTQGNYSETSVNFQSGIEKPLGLLQTVWISVSPNFSKDFFNVCSIGRLWKVFKVYFMFDSFEDLAKI